MTEREQSVEQLRSEITGLHETFQQAMSLVLAQPGTTDTPCRSPLWGALRRSAIPVAGAISPGSSEHVTLALRVATVAFLAGCLGTTTSKDAVRYLRTFLDVSTFVDNEQQRNPVLQQRVAEHDQVIRSGAQILWLAPVERESGRSRVEMVLSILFSYGWYHCGQGSASLLDTDA